MEIPGLDTAAWDRWVAYRKAIKKPLKEATLHAAALKLAKYGDDQAEVVDQSIANQWQGLFDLQKKKLAPGEKPQKTREQKAADDFADKMDWLKGVVARNLKEVEAKLVVGDPHLMIMVMCFFGPLGVKRIKERAAVGA